MEEVFEISDRVTVLRDGKKISSLPAAEVTSDGAIRDMVGRKLEEFKSKSHVQPGKLLLSVRGLQKAGAFADISFDVHRGEVLGFAGLVGARRTDVGLALFGIELADSGEVIFDGKLVEIHSPDQILQIGLAYATEDRRGLGLTMSMSVASNISLPTLRKYLSRLGLIKRAQEDLAAERARERLGIRAASVRVEVAHLSGGNQQKVLLSKWLNAGPQLLVLDEPTRGIDVGAKAEVHQMIHELAAQGLGIILISSDLPEVLTMSDRILVMREGRQTALFTRAEATQEKVLGAAMGQANSVRGGN
jgi:rhamnose transport system ATP-binding protein